MHFNIYETNILVDLRCCITYEVIILSESIDSLNVEVFRLFQ